jgi:uncharacterized protein (TIGR02145 family)
MKNTLKIGTKIVAFAFGALPLLFTTNTANAETTYSDLNLSINSVISLTLTNCDSSNPETVTLNIEPTATGTFKSTCQNVNVVTNTLGYELSVKALSQDATNNLLYQNPTTLNPAPKIPATNTGTFASPTILPNDTWGYAIEKQTGMTGNNFDSTYTIDNASNKYANLPITDQQLYETDQFPAPITNFRAYYASKLTLNTTAGAYKTTITYTAVGVEIPQPTQFLQTFTQAKCQALDIYQGTVVNPNEVDKLVTLIDARDDQAYLVGKLVDGNCWMLNNLRLGLDNQAVTLSNTDSDLSTINSFTLPLLTQSHSSGSFDDPRIYGPLTADVTDDGDDYASGDPASDHFGGYLYNWSAVTAGETTSSIVTGSALNSICPKKWRLPNGGLVGDVHNDFDQLTAKMAGYSDNQGQYQTDFDYGALFSDGFGFAGPFRGVLSGVWDFDSGYGGIGQSELAGLWSASAFLPDANHAFLLTFRPSDYVYSSVDINRHNGLSVRCLLRP